MPPLYAPCVLARRHLLPPKTGGVGDIVNGQDAGGDNLFAVEVGEGYLGGADEPKVVLVIVVDVIGELGQLSRADHALPLDHKGRVYLLVAVLAGMQVEHEGDEGSLQPSA
ncbi:hypothetical protein ES703_89392 [subsurface metagenome]